MDGHLERQTSLHQLGYVLRMVSIDKALIRLWSPRCITNLTLPPGPAREGITVVQYPTVVQYTPKYTPEIEGGIEFDWAMAKALVQL